MAIKLNTGKVAFPIEFDNGDSVNIFFNPNDPDLFVRFSEFEKRMSEKIKDIDDIVRIVRFDGWQTTVAGKREVKRALRSVVSVKYKIKDKELFDKAYGYIEQYY